MGQPLLERLQQIRRDGNRLIVLEGLSWLLAFVLGGLVIVSLIDWMVRFERYLDRALLAGVVLLAGLVLFWLLVTRPLLKRMTILDLALAIEQIMPGWNSELSSSIQFLETGQSDRTGSVELQAAVIQRALDRIDELQSERLLDRSRFRRAAAVLTMIALSSLLLAVISPASASIAVQRLAIPGDPIRWPRRCQLVLLHDNLQPLALGDRQPLRLAEGEQLILLVRNRRGTLPGDLRVEFQFPDGQIASESLPIVERYSESGERTQFGELQLRAGSESLRFRVLGGDDRDGHWIGIETQQAPSLKSLRIRLEPPAYSNAPAVELDDGVGHVRALVGTRVIWTAEADRDLSDARLIIGNSPLPGLRRQGPRLFEVTHVLTEPGSRSYHFELTDSLGVRHPDPPAYPLHVIPDLPPRIRLEEPSVDQLATPAAGIPIVVSIEDDFAVESAELIITKTPTEPGEARRIPLDFVRGQEIRVEHMLELSELQIATGTGIELRVTALDAFGRRHELVSESVRRRIDVVSIAEKQSELDSREATAARELRDLVTAQQQILEGVRDLLIQAEQAGELQDSDLDLLKRLEFDQQQIAIRISGPQSVVRELMALEEELQRNRIPATSQTNRLHAAVIELLRVNQNQLAPVVETLTRVRKQQEIRAAAATRTQPAATASRQAQDLRSLVGLQTYLAESLLAIWSSLNQEQIVQNLVRDLQGVVNGYEQLRGETAAVISQTLTQSVNELRDQDKANLARLAARHRRMADGFRTWFNRFQQTPDEALDPLLRQHRDEISREIVELAIRERLDEMPPLLERNRVGDVLSRAEALSADLRALLQLVANEQPTDIETRLRRLREIAEEAEHVERNLLDQQPVFDDNGVQPSDPRWQHALKTLSDSRDKLGAMARKLKRIDLAGLSETAAQAADHLRSLGTATGTDQPDRSTGFRSIRDRIEQLRRDLARAINSAEMQLAMNRLNRMQELLTPLRDAQQLLLQEARKLDAQFEASSRWTRVTLKQLVTISQRQTELAQSLQSIAEQLQPVPVFHEALQAASEAASQVAGMLRDRQAGTETTNQQQQIIDRLSELVEAAALAGNRKPGGTPTGNNAGGATGPASDLSPQAAGLKLITLWQARINAETIRLRESTAPVSPGSWQRLSREQKQLADLVQQMLTGSGPSTNRNQNP